MLPLPCECFAMATRAVMFANSRIAAILAEDSGAADRATSCTGCRGRLAVSPSALSPASEDSCRSPICGDDMVCVTLREAATVAACDASVPGFAGPSSAFAAPDSSAGPCSRRSIPLLQNAPVAPRPRGVREQFHAAARLSLLCFLQDRNARSPRSRAKRNHSNSMHPNRRVTNGRQYSQPDSH